MSSSHTSVEFNETCKAKDGSLVHLRILLKRSSQVQYVWGLARLTDSFLDYIVLDGHRKIPARVMKKDTSKYTEDDALVGHMLTNRELSNHFSTNSD